MIKRQIFPYFGGKGRVAVEVWARFGAVSGYLEPFGGSLAVTLRNPHPEDLKSETVNDFDGFIANFWRAVAAAPQEVAKHADWPVNQLDLHARHAWLIGQSEGLREKLRADPDYYDPKVAGLWVWGIAQWIGGGWCVRKSLQRPHLGNTGKGVHSLGQRPHLGSPGAGGFYDLYHRVAKRLRFTCVTCCDWKSLRSTLHNAAQWGVFLDPPYTSASGRCMSLYGNSSADEATLGEEVAAWALSIGDKHRVALCGIEGEYKIPYTWDRYYWKTGGYAYGNRDRAEVVWFSPACLQREN